MAIIRAQVIGLEIEPVTDDLTLVHCKIHFLAPDGNLPASPLEFDQGPGHVSIADAFYGLTPPEGDTIEVSTVSP